MAIQVVHTSLLRRLVLCAVLPIAAAVVLPAQELIRNNRFETTASAGIPDWAGDTKGGRIAVLPGPDGKAVLTVRCDAALVDAKSGLGLRQDFALQPAWKKLAASARARVGAVVPGAQGWQVPKIFLVFRDSRGKQLPGFPSVAEFRAPTAGFTNIEKEIPVPEGATSGSLQIEIYGALAEMQVSHVSLTPVLPPTNSVDAPVPPGEQVYWDREPVETESATRGRVCLNGLWQFSPAQSDASPEKGYGYIWVPGAWHTKLGRFPGLAGWGKGPEWESFPAESRAAAYAQLGRAWYRRTIRIPDGWAGRQIVLDFRRVCTDAEISLDGQKAGRVNWPWGEVDISALVKPGKTHTLDVQVVSVLRQSEITEFTGTAADQVFKKKIELDARGITGDVFLVGRPRGARIADVFVKPSTRLQRLAVDVELQGAGAGKLSLGLRLLDERGKLEKSFATNVALRAGDRQTLSLAFPWTDPRLWDIGQPNRYTLLLKAEGAGLSDEYAQPFGFREFWIEGKKFFLNGKEIRLRPRIAEVNEGDRNKQSIELIDGSIDGLMALGGNIQELWPWDHWQRGTVRAHELWYERADLKGWGMIGALGSMTGFASTWDKTPPERLAWERLAAEELRRVRNHPSVLIWIHSPNRFGNRQDQHPMALGNRAELEGVYDKAGLASVSGGLQANAFIRSLDPTRPVTTHQGGIVGDIHTVNNYLSWHPLQEQSEWLSAWLERGDRPFISIEFGFFPPCDYRRGRNAWQGSVKSELQQTEYLAATFGAAAYAKESAATRAWNPKNFVKGQEYAFPPVGGSYFIHDPLLDEQIFQQGLVLNRAWRTAGITGGVLQWEHGHGFDPNALSNGVAIYHQRREITGPFQPGRRGAYVREASPLEQYYLTPHGAATIRGGQYWNEACRETLAWIVGPQAPGDPMAFTAQDHHVPAGATVAKRAALLNDSRQAQPFEMSWQAIQDGRVIASGSERGNLAVSETRFLPIQFQVPESRAVADLSLALTAHIGTNLHRDAFALRVYPRAPKASGVLSLFDPLSKSAGMLRDLGYTVEVWNGKAGKGLLVVGREALRPGEPLPAALRTHALGGGRLLLLSQTEAWLTGQALRVGHQVVRRVFPVSERHPGFAGIDSEDLRDWAGRSTLVADRDVSVKQSDNNSYPRWGWHWGNRGGVCSLPVEKPHTGAWRPILECDFDLAYSPLMELELGEGRVTLCQLDLEDHVAVDPAAFRLALATVEWARLAPLSPRREVRYLGGPSGEARLKNLGLQFRTGTDGLTGAPLLVLGENAPMKRDALEALVQRGANVLCLDAAAAVSLGAALSASAPFEGVPQACGWSECRGLSPSDVRLRVPFPVSRFQAGGGFEQGLDGFLAARTLGSGRLIACRFLELQEAESLTYLRFTRWRQARALSQVLANLGARFQSDDAFLNTAEAAGENRNELGLAGVWKGWQTLAIPATPEGQTPPDDPGISDRAKALVGAASDGPGATDVRFPGAFEETGGSWAKYEGEAVFRKTVQVPEAWAGKDLELGLGVVDDFDDTFWNGEKIGSVGKSQKEWWKFSRRYVVPGRLVKAGPNVIAVRIFDNFNQGGIFGPGPDMVLSPKSRGKGMRGFYHSDYRADYPLGDDPHRYYRW